ncbi:MAG: hypothetical protein COB37_01885 [Kordiimonadales bacterium]|nr:MAG: hypothetical protein COB37_01885 [Kordiimonadales bacterium]
MSFGVKVHYEILGRRSTSWTILEVIDDRSSATEKAEQLWNTRGYKGIRVLKETYNKQNHEFTSVEILSRGSVGKTSKYDETGTISPCLSPDDLYSPDGLRSIWQLLGNTLKDWRITPTELLHNLEHYYKLYNFGDKLQNAVQRTAVSFEDTEGSIQDRMKKLYRVIDASVDIMKANKESVPSLEMGRLKPIIVSLEKKPNKQFLLISAMVDYVRPAMTMGDKFGRIAVFLAKGRAEWVTESLDQLLSEFLMHNSVLDAMLGEKDDRGMFMTELAHLQAGSLSVLEEGNWSFTFSTECLRINGFLADSMLPMCSRVLFNRLKAELSSSKQINDDGLIAQLETLNELQETILNLKQDVHSIDAINQEIVSRAGRLINSQSISDLIMGIKQPIAQIHALLDLETVTIGNSNKRTVANFILPILANPMHEGTFMGLGQQPLARMNELVGLQKKVMAASFSEMHRRQIAEKLDTFCRTILNNTQILKKLHQRDVSLQKKTEQLLSMMADGYFTAGDCFDRAELQARAYMKQPGFTEGLIAGMGRAAAEQALLEFKTLLDDSGFSAQDEQADPEKEAPEPVQEESEGIAALKDPSVVGDYGAELSAPKV